MGNPFSRLSEGQKKILGWLALAAALGIGALVLQPAPSPAIKKQEAVQALGLREKWEGELEAILDAALGIKGSKVFLTLERGPSLSIAYSLTEEQRGGDGFAEEKRRSLTPTVLRDDAERREKPLILEEGEPTVRGVLVLLACAGDGDLRLQIAQAVQTVLQLPMYRIEVLFKE